MVDFCYHSGPVWWGIPLEVAEEKKSVFPMRRPAVFVINAVVNNVEVSIVTIRIMMFLDMSI